VVLVAYLVPADGKHGRGGFDYAGAATFMAAMLGLMVGLTQGPKVGWTSAIVLVAGAAFAGFTVIFARIERAAPAPFIDAHLFRNRPYSAAVGVISLQVFLQFGLALILPLFLVRIQGQPSSLTGLVVFSLPMTMAIVAPFAGRLADQRGNRMISLIGMILVAIGAAALIWLDVATPAFALMAMLIVIGIGMGFVQSPTAASVTQVAPQEKLGVALGLYNMIRFMGGMLGATILGIMLDIASPQLGLLSAFRFDFGVVVILGGFAALLTLSLPGRLTRSTGR
jgi:MFS family permease